ncbi:MAG: pyrroline-5-carboxylate reductase [Planctomycetes bacterium]|nr:pyrroline-5-carboxylate reductase [Planctomycetota bacterium]
MAYEKIGFIGAGKMGEALMSGIIAARSRKASDIAAYDASDQRLAQVGRALGIAPAKSNKDVVKTSDIVFLAVKPNIVPDVLSEIRSAVTAKHLLVSIAAGVPLAAIEAKLKPKCRVIRVMPNTPCLVGATAAAFALGAGATSDDAKTVASLLEAVGIAFRVEEKLLDAVTGLSGSGPAYIYVAIEALADGGVRMGLPRDTALKLAAQTVLGAAKMVLETGQHPGMLKDAVASPGGTTIAALQVLEDRGFRAALIAAVQAATKRSKELSQ